MTSNTGATRVLPYRGAITVNPNRTTPDVDTGSIDPVLASFLGANDIAATWDGKAAFDDLPYIYAAGIKGGVSPTGSIAKTWTFQAASLTADAFEYLTDEWGDDVTSDVIIAGGGVIDSFGLSFGEDLAAFDLTASLMYARAQFGTGFTGGLTLTSTPAWVYGAHTVVYMDTVPGAIGISPIASAVHRAEITVSNNLDKKRFANGSNTAFQLTDFGRGPRELLFKLTVAKTSAMVTEAQTLDDLPVAVRYFDVKTTSTETVGASGTPYSNSIRFAAELISRDDAEIANNSVIVLTYRGKYDATLGYALRASVVNGLASL